MKSKSLVTALKVYFMFASVYCLGFITKDVLVINGNSSFNAYFSYSLLLQTGDNPAVIVGAPKKNTTYYPTFGIETVFRCTLEGKSTCEKILFSESDMVLVLKLSVLVRQLDCYSFNTDDVIIISDVSVKNTYFSYSLLLQAGETVSSLIVGAPRNNNNLQLGGDVYKCDIEAGGKTSCVQYPAGRLINSTSTNGNFFGMSLDGEDYVNGALVACAPRTVTSHFVNANYLRGYCIYMKNSSQVMDYPVEIKPVSTNTYYKDSSCCDNYKRPYYDFAFAMAGFDVSFYSDENQQEVLLGAPGIKKFNGATLSYSIEDQGSSLLPTRNRPVQTDEDTYFGYSVTTAKFRRGSDKSWFIAGAPRSNYLKGKVTIYYYDPISKEKMNVVATFYGEEAGSYFGASVLALDVTNDGHIDLMVGAPMTAGNTWDEGSVFFFKGLNENSYVQKLKLTGSNKNGSRFGSAIVSLGDFDLDGFNDVAISAPYEDSGRGAVYIYKGSSEGLIESYSQRLSPMDFNVRSHNVQRFGMGMSRGNDIDGNGHNDFAIGAYKSDQVFIIKSYSIIDYQFHLSPSVSTITNDTEFDMRFCLLYTKRSEKNILPQVMFNLSIDLDYRSVDGKIVDNINANLGQTTCKNYQVPIRSTMTDILPFQMDLTVGTETEDIIAHGPKTLEYKIPYSHGCGSDNICVTDLIVELVTESQQVVIGVNNQVNLIVKVNNYGEPAYQCEVKIVVPDGIELRNQTDCTRNGKNYTCLIDDRLIGFEEKEYIFAVGDVQLDIPSIEIAVEVTSLFRNKGDKNKATLTIPLELISSANFDGKSVPDHAEVEIKSNISDLEVVYTFSVGKTGPSPLKLDVEIFLPVIEHEGRNVFHILEIKGNIDTIQEVSCIPAIIEDESDFNFENAIDLEVPLNRTVVLSCNDKENCQKYTCRGEYLYKPAQVAAFEIKILIRSSLLVSKYKKELSTKDVIALLPVAFQNSPSGRVGASSLYLIFVYGVDYLPLWVYLAAPSIGIILLLLTSYGLYKCHFFDRVYKDKLDQEKILKSSDSSVEAEIFDDVVFRPMEEKEEKGYL